MFAILFMYLLANQQGFCDLYSGSTYGINIEQCEQIGVWHVYDINFDNIY